MNATIPELSTLSPLLVCRQAEGRVTSAAPGAHDLLQHVGCLLRSKRRAFQLGLR